MAINEGFVAVEDLVEVKKLFTSEQKIDSRVPEDLQIVRDAVAGPGDLWRGL